jgi:leucyl-tRNA synthetase
MILGENGIKMGKRYPEFAVNPLDVVNEFGADTLRLYEMFMGDYTQDAPWSTDSLRGCRRFIDKVIRIKDKINDDENYSKESESLIHKTIKKVQNDLTSMAYNTAVSSLMILANSFDEKQVVTKGEYHLLLTLLNPIAPHITEELNESLGYKPLCETSWPEFDESKTIDSEIEIPIQVNGKVRGTVKIQLDEAEDSVKEKAKEQIKDQIADKTIIKEIYVKNKIFNIVVK